MKPQIVYGLLLAGFIFSVQARPHIFQLSSPTDGDAFAVAKPLLFWESSVGATCYEVFIDDVPVAKVSAKPIPVMSVGPATELSEGSHHWSVKVLDANGNSCQTSNRTFIVQSATNWPTWAIGPFVRYGQNPILRPHSADWEHGSLYNPGVIFDGGRFRMLYRGQDTNRQAISREGYAESFDGVTFLCDTVPVIDATEKYEKHYGCEDARLVKYNGIFYAFYTGNFDITNGNKVEDIALCEAASTNGINWTKLGVIQTGTKNGAIVRDPFGTPVKIGGKFVMYAGNQNFGVCYSENLTNWTPIHWFDFHMPAGWSGPYEPCVAVANYSPAHPDDIVLFIAGTLNGKGKWYYAISEALFSKNDPEKKIAQLNDCIMKPRESYESGLYTNCLWMNSIVLHDNQWWMHYGAGDRNIGLATAPFKK
jgi:predicted GH43/DUF377 family glycosyl hydrolase